MERTVHVCIEVIKVYGLRIFGLHLDAWHWVGGGGGGYFVRYAISLQQRVPLVNREIICFDTCYVLPRTFYMSVLW
jgi:uncharacterized membrane protein YdcZ (DUF606 family)